MQGRSARTRAPWSGGLEPSLKGQAVGVAEEWTLYDVCIIGGGPAGLAAATWLGRFRRSVVLVDSQEYRNRWTERAHGYLGMDPMDPADFRRRAQGDLAQYERITLVRDRVTAVEKSSGRFCSTGEREQYLSKRLILATGVVDAFPQIEGFEEHYGAGVFHCPLCDGYEARGKHVVVLGYSEESARFARTLLNWAASVTLVARGRAQNDQAGLSDADRDPAVDIVWARPVAFEGLRNSLAGVRLDSGRFLDCEVAFFSTGNYPKSSLADGLGCRFTEENCIQVDDDGLTNVKGLYAAGDLTSGPHLIQVAAAKGAIAGSACAESLLA